MFPQDIGRGINFQGRSLAEFMVPRAPLTSSTPREHPARSIKHIHSPLSLYHILAQVPKFIFPQWYTFSSSSSNRPSRDKLTIYSVPRQHRLRPFRSHSRWWYHRLCPHWLHSLCRRWLQCRCSCTSPTSISQPDLPAPRRPTFSYPIRASTSIRIIADVFVVRTRWPPHPQSPTLRR